MEFKQLEAFVHVVKEGSFTKAAHKVFLSQPTISSHIGELEKELGVQLLVRSTKSVYPTKVGQEFLGYAMELLALRQQAAYAVSASGTELRGQVDILSSSVPAQYLLPEILAAFYKQHPTVSIRVHQATSQQVTQQLDGWKYDFGIIGAPLSSKKFHQHPFYKDQLVLIAPPGMLGKISSQEEIKSALLSHPIVLNQEGSGTRKGTEKLLAQLGLDLENLTVAAFFSDNQSVIHSVSKGMGLGIVSSLAADFQHNQGFVNVYPFVNLGSQRFFSLIYLKEMTLSPVIKKLTDFIQDYYKKE